ncbi:MAG: LPS assembly protein LptD [bacterium]
MGWRNWTRWLMPCLGLILVASTGGFCITLEKARMPQVNMAEEAPIHIEADSLTYDRQADQYIAEGHVEIVRGGMTLRAQRVVIDNRTRLATAEGKVQVFQETARIWSDKMELHMDEQTGRLTNATLYFEPYEMTVTGEEIQRLGEDHYLVRGATLSSCSGDVPDWRFAADEVEIKVSGDAVAKGATFQVRNVPIFYFPYLVYPTARDRRTGFLLPEYRSDSRVGYGFSLPFFWAIGNSYDATFTESYFSKKGFQQGVEFRYAPWESLKGSIQGEFIHDQQDPDPAIIHRGGMREDRDRWRVRMEQEAKLPWNIVSRANVDLVSDNYYLEEFSVDHDERYLRYQPSILNATKRWDQYLLAGEVRYFRSLEVSHNDTDLTPQKLPSLMFNRMNLPFMGLPLTLGWASSFDHIWRPEKSRAETLSFSPVVSLPLQLSPYLSVVPFAAWQESVFATQDRLADGSDGHMGTYHYGVSFSSELSRIYPWGGERISSVKHTIQPELRFDAIGHSTSGDFPGEFLERVPSDRLISLVMTHFLTSKLLNPDGSSQYREWVRFRLVQPFSLREQFRDLDELDHERRPWRPLLSELELRLVGQDSGRLQSEIRRGVWAEPRKYLSLKFREEFDWYEKEFDDMSVTLRGGDGRGDEMSISYGWGRRLTGKEERVKFVQANVGIRTLPFLDLLGHTWYNQDEERFARYGYGLILHPSCWAVRFTHTIEPGFGGRETDHAFRVQVYLLGLDRVASF